MNGPIEAAIEEHGTTVLRVCRAVLGPGPDAEDAWQDTFLSLFRAWPDLDDEVNLTGWLVRVAHHRAVDVIRARVRQAPGRAELFEAEERPSPVGRPGARDLDLWSALARLPERQRLAVAYHHLAGFPHAETAALIGGTPEAVRRAASDGISALRRRLGSTHGTPSRHGGTGRPSTITRTPSRREIER